MNSCDFLNSKKYTQIGILSHGPYNWKVFVGINNLELYILSDAPNNERYSWLVSLTVEQDISQHTFNTIVNRQQLNNIQKFEIMTDDTFVLELVQAWIDKGQPNDQ